MERTIKFRGKSISGDWVYGDLIQLDNQSCIAGSHQWAAVLQNNSLELGVDEVIPETIGQFTGLKDKNGVEIYEGDIFHLGDKNITYTVVWHDTGLRGQQNGTLSFVGLNHWQYRIEIIGNISDNPELIEKI